jgi:hypothetical protein
MLVKVRIPGLYLFRGPEMEFLDINLTKAPCHSHSLLLADFKENHTLFWFLKILTKKSAKKRKLESFHQ